MTTDTKDVARFDLWGFDGFMEPQKRGEFVRFKDHARVVGELTREAKGLSQSLTDALECEKDYLCEISELRSEVEALKAKIEERSK